MLLAPVLNPTRHGPLSKEPTANGRQSIVRSRWRHHGSFAYGAVVGTGAPGVPSDSKAAASLSRSTLDSRANVAKETSGGGSAGHGPLGLVWPTGKQHDLLACRSSADLLSVRAAARAQPSPQTKLPAPAGPFRKFPPHVSLGWLPGSLKATCPLLPIPTKARSIPPASAMASS